MPLFISRKDQDVACRVAEEAARRAREKKRQELREKINTWRDELRRVEGIQIRLQKEKSCLERQMDAWAVHKNRCAGDLILSEIVLVNRFEGVCADEVKKKFTDSVGEMNIAYAKTGMFRNKVDMQIQRLGQYISFINDQITSLTRELNAI